MATFSREIEKLGRRIIILTSSAVFLAFLVSGLLTLSIFHYEKTNGLQIALEKSLSTHIVVGDTNQIRTLCNSLIEGNVLSGIILETNDGYTIFEEGDFLKPRKGQSIAFSGFSPHHVGTFELKQGENVLGRVWIRSLPLTRFVPQIIGFFLVVVLVTWSIIGYYVRRSSSKIVRNINSLNNAAYTQDEEETPVFDYAEFKSVYYQLQKLFKNREDAVKNAAIAQTVQMLAHDVRKPFSMIKMVLDQLISNKNSASEIAEQFLPEVGKALISADAMIKDVMEAGSEVEPVKEEVDVRRLLIDSINDFRRFDNQPAVEISYSLSHTQKVLVDPARIMRVFTNLITNASEAMNGSGRLWFSTRDKPGFVEIEVGNSNSYIPEGDRRKLFDAFFTKGKKGGTGLGLAIVKKIVCSHRGSIICTSDQVDGTAFIFTLPVSVEM